MIKQNFNIIRVFILGVLLFIGLVIVGSIAPKIQGDPSEKSYNPYTPSKGDKTSGGHPSRTYNTPTLTPVDVG